MMLSFAFMVVIKFVIKLTWVLLCTIIDKYIFNRFHGHKSDAYMILDQDAILRDEINLIFWGNMANKCAGISHHKNYI